MNKHLEMLNTAMAKDGMRGCETMMRNRHRPHTHGQKHGHTHGTRQRQAHDMKHGKAGERRLRLWKGPLQIETHEMKGKVTCCGA